MFVFSIVLFWRKFKRQATNEPTSCGFSEFFNWCQTMDGVFSYHILLPSIQYSKCYHLCVKWMKRAKQFWSWGLIWSWGTERAGDTFLSSLMSEQSWITSIYLNFKLHDLADFATVNVHDIFAANRLCHVAAHSIARFPSMVYIIFDFEFFIRFLPSSGPQQVVAQWRLAAPYSSLIFRRNITFFQQTRYKSRIPLQYQLYHILSLEGGGCSSSLMLNCIRRLMAAHRGDNHTTDHNL